MKKTVAIIGGGAGGMTTATQIKKQDPEIRVVLFDKGSYVSWAGCPTPYYIADQLPKESVIHFTPEYFIKNRGIEVYINHEVTAIDIDKKTLTIEGDTVHGEFAYDSLVFSPGAKAFLPDIEDLDKSNFPKGVFVLRNAEHAFAIKEYIQEVKPKNGVIIGGGFVGLEMAEALRYHDIATTVVKRSEILPFLEGRVQRKKILAELENNQVDLQIGNPVAKIEINNGTISKVILTNGQMIDADFLLISIGARPNTELLEKAGVKLDHSRLFVDEQMLTTAPEVYALGDVIWTKNLITGKPIYSPHGDVADKQALIVGNNVCGAKLSFKGVIGSASTSVFDLQIARTGLTLKEAEENGFKAAAVSVKAFPRVPGFEGTVPGMVRAVYDTENMVLLGATIVSKEAASQFIDQFAIAITAKMSIDDLFNVDYAYSPTTAVVWNPLLAVYRKIFNR